MSYSQYSNPETALRRGVGLLEMLLGLLLAALILASVTLLYEKGVTEQKAHETVREAMLVVGLMNNSQKSMSDGDAFNSEDFNKILSEDPEMPRKFRASGGIVSPYGSINVVSMGGLGWFAQYYYSLLPAACKGLLSLTGSGAFEFIQANDIAQYRISFMPTGAELTRACNSYSSNTVILVSRTH